MKKIVFGLQLDNKVAPIGMGEEGIEYFLGPQQFTIRLETRCGIKQPEENQESLRTEMYRQHLQAYLTDFPNVFFKASFLADPFATSQTLLNLRDQLLLCGWDGKTDKDAPNRLSVLSDIEHKVRNNSFWPKGWADRQQFLLEKLPYKGSKNLEIFLVEPLDLLPVFWQHVLSALQKSGARIHQISSLPSAADSSDIGVFQRFIYETPEADTPKFKAKGDGSLILFTGKRDTEMASWFAKWMNENKSWFPALLLPDKTRTLDNALISEGLPSLGLQTRSDARPVLQLLKLVPEFLWQPIDPAKLLAFLTLPLQPVPRTLATKLASVLAKKPGLFGPDWQDVLKKVEAVEPPEHWLKIKKEYDFWFNRDRYSPKELVPKSIIIDLFNHIKSWSQLEINDYESKITIESQTQTVLNLLENLPESSLSHLEIVRIMRTALEPIARSPYQAQKNHIRVTHHASAILEPVEDLIWWTFTEKERDYFFSIWYSEELHYLNSIGIYPDLPAKENQRISWYRKQAFFKTASRLFLFLPERVEGAEIQPFPLFGDLNACFDSIEPFKINLDIHQLNASFPPAFNLLADFNLPPLQLIQPSPQDKSPLFIELPHINLLPEREAESFTSLESLFYYPYKWAFQYKLGLYKADNLEMADEKRLYGNLAHRLFEQVIENPAYWNKDEKAIRAWMNENIPVLFEQEGATLLRYGMEPERVSLHHKLSHSIVHFLQTMKQAGWEPEAVEKELNGQFCDIKISGIADLIFKRGNDRAIIDLKWSGKKYRTDLQTNNEDLQLALYHSLLQQNGTFNQIYTAFYIVEAAHFVSRNMEQFSESTKSVSSENPSITYKKILDKMSATYYWRKAQLSSGQIEWRTKASSKQLEEHYGAILLDLLEMKKENSTFDDFKTLVNFPV
jgi:hypothetical protein